MSQPAQGDIATGVGVTALVMAVGRAIETQRPDGLITDPYAAAFVQAGQSLVPLFRLDADFEIPWVAGMATYIGVRSKFFDEFFASVSADGLKQVVLFAAGLDSRAFRLDWAPGTIVYELDTPEVLRFKDCVLAEQGTQPRCVRRTLSVDLREDWPSALRQVGFDPSCRTVWLVEGLLPYLPDDAKASLFSRMHQMSVVGSRIAVEHHDYDTVKLLPTFQTMVECFGFNPAELWADEQNYDPVKWLADHRWAVSASRVHAVAQRYHRPLDATTPQPIKSNLLITAELQHDEIAVVAIPDR